IVSARRIGGVQAENGSSVTYAPGGDLYVAGAFQDMLQIGDKSVQSTGGSNLFVLRYTDPSNQDVNPEQQIAWIKTAANAAAVSSPETGYPRLSISPQGDLLVAGGFTSSAAFDDAALSSRGLEDAFVAQLPVTAGQDSFFESLREWLLA